MTAVSYSIQMPELDDDGLIVDPALWNEEVAEEIADQLNIRLGAEHWVAIYSLRNYYTRFGVAPAMSNICRENAKDKHWIHNIFGSCLNAWRVAGLSNPGEEAKTYLNDM
jgi:TusE/DsrC/DsvC family sulfur relay protein